MLKYLLNIVVYLALAVWIGSLVFFGAGVASVLFQPDMLPGRTLAGAVNSVILGRLGKIEIVAGVLLVGGTLYTAARYKHLLNWLVLLLSVGMLATAIYYTGTLYPRMESLRVAIGDFDHLPAEKMTLKAQFDEGHVLYSTLVKGVLGAGLLVLALHTVAMVRYTEHQANRYRTLEHEWLQFKDSLAHPMTTLAKIVSPGAEDRNGARASDAEEEEDIAEVHAEETLPGDVPVEPRNKTVASERR